MDFTEKLLPEEIKDELGLGGYIPVSPTGYLSFFTSLDPHVSSQNQVIYIYQYNSFPKEWGNSSPDQNFKLKEGLHHNTLVEVARGADVVGGYTWFYYMPGTGNWFNLGKTIVFNDHHEAFKVAEKDGVKFEDPVNGGSQDQTYLAEYFLNHGYETIQFTQRAEGIFKYEIFNLKNKQESKDNPCIPHIRTRGNDSCNCLPTLGYLNCATTNNPCDSIILPAV